MSAHRCFSGLLLAMTVIAQGNAPYSIDPAQSKLEIHVTKKAFSGFGHDHLIAAKQLSGQVSLTRKKIDQSPASPCPRQSLTVSPWESKKTAASPNIWRAKGPRRRQFPEIIFSSERLRAKKLPRLGLTLSAN